MAPKTIYGTLIPPPLNPVELIDIMGRWRMRHDMAHLRIQAMDWARFVMENGYYVQAVFFSVVMENVPGIVALFSTAQSTHLHRSGQDPLNSWDDILYKCNSVCNFLCSCVRIHENQTAFRLLYWYAECSAYPASIVSLRRSMKSVALFRRRRTGRGSWYLLRSLITVCSWWYIHI